MTSLHLPAGTAAHGRDLVLVTPERAGWRFTGLHVIALDAGGVRMVATEGREMVVLPLSGSCSVVVAGRQIRLRGRRDVFSDVSDFAYLPVDCEVRIASVTGGEFALAWAEAQHRLEPAYGPAEEVGVEVRGAGRATRQINNIFTAGTCPAQRLIVVEVLTPAGNWSSYPPHKHDDATVKGEAALEEIYYFRIQGKGGFGMHRTYAADGEFDETVTVRDGDVFLVPKGYHGPCVAAPEYAMYYLNVLAGPADGRALAYTDDPAYAWIRQRWVGMAPDPRVPLTRSDGAGSDSPAPDSPAPESGPQKARRFKR